MSGIHPDATRRHILRWGAGAGLEMLGDPRADAASRRRGGVVTQLLTAEPPTLTTLAHSAYNAVVVSPKVTEGLLIGHTVGADGVSGNLAGIHYIA